MRFSSSLFRLGRTLGRLGGALVLPLVLVACAGNPYEQQPTRRPEPRTVPPAVRPAPAPAPRVAPPPAPRSPSVQKTHPRYAPPPHLDAYWDNRLGVYVVKGANLYYRERLYYRREGEWLCAPTPQGPWEAVAPASVPPGLRR